MIPDDVIEEVRARADIVEVVGESVPLKRAGKDYKGRCPFHEDRTPSFFVVPSKGFYNCFGCGESGDVFAFVMKRQGMDFLEAVRHVGARFGVEVREVKRGRAEEDPLRPHYEANAFAREFYRERLADPEGGRTARDYLEKRGIDAETRERFGLGYAPDDWRALREAAEGHGIPLELLLEVGLATSGEKVTDPYDRFRNRIVFPIEGLTGRVLGFGGRVLGAAGKGAPKYLNSPESPVYRKGEVLYALGWNRHEIRKAGVALVVEGYMDVVSLSAGGVDHAVASLGTALTEGQARLLKRYAGRALLLFDSDDAGLRASFRAADTLLAAGVHPSIVTLPAGEDPDSLVRKEGAAGLGGYLDGAVDVLDRKLQVLDERGFFETIDRTRTAVDKLLPTLRAAADPALRDIYVAKVAERTGVRRETLEAELARGESAPPGAFRPGGRGGPGRGATRLRGGRRFPELGPERQLLVVLLRMREWVDRTMERIGPEVFRDEGYRAIFEALIEDPQLNAPTPDMPPDVARKLESLLGDPEELEHTERVFQESLAVLHERSLSGRYRELRTALETETDPTEQRRIAGELQQLRKERPGGWNVARRDSPARPARDHER